MIREKTYVLTNLYFSFSGLISARKSDLTFSNLFGATSFSFLEEFVSPDQIAESSVEELIEFIFNKRKNHYSNIDDKITFFNTYKYFYFKLMNITNFKNNN